MEQAAIYELLAQELGEGALGWHDEGVEPWAEIAPASIVEAATFLRADERTSLDLLMCLSGIDWDGYDEAGKGKSVAILGYAEDGTPETSDRVGEGDFGVAYHLYSYAHGHKFTLRLRVPRDQVEVATVSAVWPTGAWHEREAYDLVGITFTGHPDLRRILLDDEWVGHPLRKDYVMPTQWNGVPLTGNDNTKNPNAPAETPDEAVAPGEGDGPGEG